MTMARWGHCAPPDRTVRVWRLDNGEPVGKPLGRGGRAGGLSRWRWGRIRTATPVIVAGGGMVDATVQVWQLEDGEPVTEPLRGHEGWVRAVAVGALPGGRYPVIVSADGDAVRVWRLDNGEPVGKSLRGGLETELRSVATGALPDGTLVHVAGSGDRCGAGVAAADGVLLGKPLRGHDGTVKAVAVGTLLDGTPSSSAAATTILVRRWRLADGKPVGKL